MDITRSKSYAKQFRMRYMNIFTTPGPPSWDRSHNGQQFISDLSEHLTCGPYVNEEVKGWRRHFPKRIGRAEGIFAVYLWHSG